MGGCCVLGPRRLAIGGLNRSMGTSNLRLPFRAGVTEKCGEEVSTTLFFVETEDLRTGSEEGWRFGGLVGKVTLYLNALSHKGSAGFNMLFQYMHNTLC